MASGYEIGAIFKFRHMTSYLLRMTDGDKINTQKPEDVCCINNYL